MGVNPVRVGFADRRRDHQEPACYRLEQTRSTEIFGVVHGPQSLKSFAFAPREPLLQIERTKDGFAARQMMPQPEKVAVIGLAPAISPGSPFKIGFF
ncbi:MAG TPA: hypothetical protein VN666_02255 [Nitrospira sp.]|nr:hypothetical protein [Nitrospira sp.]